MRLKSGDRAPPFRAEDVDGRSIEVGDGLARPLLLSFLRYASCPMCLLRVDELARAAPSLSAAGLDVVVVLHSPRERILRHTRRSLPFAVIPDPERALYRLYRVEASIQRLILSTLLPSFFARWVAAIRSGHFGGAVDGEIGLMPADFIISAEGRIAHAHYGAHIGDHVDLTSAVTYVPAGR